MIFDFFSALLRAPLVLLEFLATHVISAFDTDLEGAELIGLAIFAVAVGFATSVFWGIAAYFGAWVFMRAFVTVGRELNFVGRVIRDNRHIRIESLPALRIGGEYPGNAIKVKNSGS